MKLNMGKRELELGGKHLGHLREANELMGDADALRARMLTDPYRLVIGSASVRLLQAEPAHTAAATSRSRAEERRPSGCEL